MVEIKAEPGIADRRSARRTNVIHVEFGKTAASDHAKRRKRQARDPELDSLVRLEKLLRPGRGDVHREFLIMLNDKLVALARAGAFGGEAKTYFDPA